MDNMELVKLLLPLLVLQFGLVVYTLVDLARNGVRNLKPWIWVLIILFVNMIGPIIYLLLGRGEARHAEDE